MVKVKVLLRVRWLWKHDAATEGHSIVSESERRVLRLFDTFRICTAI